MPSPRPRLPSARWQLFRTAAFAPLFAAAALFTLAGCGARETRVEAGIRTQTLHLGNHTEPQDLDPQICTAYTDYNILIGLFEGLTCIDEATSKPVPGTAASWDITPDGLTYTFHLRPTAKWSNGDPVTAQDFVFSYQRMLTAALAGEYSYMLWPLKNAEAYNKGELTDFAQVGVKALDPHTLELQLAQPTPYFLSLLAHQSWFPVHPPTILRFGEIGSRGTQWTRAGNLVGNGAYRLVEWSPNSRIVVERNEHYWDAAAPGVKSIVYYPVENAGVEESMFRTGQLHLTYEVLPERIGHYQQTAPDQVRVDPLLETFYVSFNVTRKPFDDPRVRRALSLAIDREAIAKSVLYGSKLPAYHYTPPNTAGYTARARVTHDVTLARELLAQAGFPGGRGFPRFEFFYNTDPINQKVLEAIQQMWRRDLGIECQLANAEFKVYLDRLRIIDYDVARRRWIGDYNDPTTYLDMFVTGGGNNQTGWSDASYDRHLEESLHMLDQDQRFELLQQVEARLLDQLPITPVFFGTRTFLIHPSVKGWVPSLLGIHRYQYVRLE